MELTYINKMLFSNLEKFAKSQADFSFDVTYFGALHFENHDELDLTPQSKVGVYV